MANPLPIDGAPFKLPLAIPKSLGFTGQDRIWKTTESYLLGQLALKKCLRCDSNNSECIFGPTRACVACQKDSKECKEGTRAKEWPTVSLPEEFSQAKPVKPKQDMKRKIGEPDRNEAPTKQRKLEAAKKKNFSVNIVEDSSKLSLAAEVMALKQRVETLETHMKNMLYKI